MEFTLELKIKELYSKIASECFYYIQYKISPIQKSELCQKLHSYLDNYDIDSGIVIRSSFGFTPSFEKTMNNPELFELQKIILSFKFNKNYEKYEMDEINFLIFEKRLLYIINKVSIYKYYTIWEDITVLIASYFNNFRFIIKKLHYDEFIDLKDDNLRLLQKNYNELNEKIVEYMESISNCKLIEIRILRCNLNFIQTNISSKEMYEFFLKLNDTLDFFDDETNVEWQNNIIEDKIKINNNNKNLIPLIRVLDQLKNFKLKNNIYSPENYKKYYFLIRKIFEARYFYVSENINFIDSFELKCILNSDTEKFIEIVNDMYEINYESYEKSFDYKILQKNILKNRFLQTLMIKIKIVLDKIYSKNQLEELNNIIYNIMKTSNLEFLFNKDIAITTDYVSNIYNKIKKDCDESKFNQSLDNNEQKKLINIICCNINEILS